MRDVTSGGDHSQVLDGRIPLVLAGLRNTVIGLRRAMGNTGIARAHRRRAAHP